MSPEREREFIVVSGWRRGVLPPVLREREFIILGYGRNKSEEIAAQPMNQVVFRALGLRVPAVHRGRRLRCRPPGGEGGVWGFVYF